MGVGTALSADWMRPARSSILAVKNQTEYIKDQWTAATMTDISLHEAHTHSAGHRQELLASDLCGCFYCQAIYPPTEIAFWIDGDQTALCARCGIDSVIGSKSGFPITHEFLTEMNRYFF